MFVSSDLKPQQIDVCRSVAKDCSVLNVCCCLITCKAHQIAIMYRSPSVSVKSALEDFRLVLQGQLPYVNSYIITGDVNINLLSNSCDTDNYINLLSDLYLQQHVCQPTRITETSATLIDHVIASKDIPDFSIINIMREIMFTPPIQFGYCTLYNTRTPSYYANLRRVRLSQTQK